MTSGITVIVTGATGTLGRALVAAAAKRQDIERIVAVCRSESPEPVAGASLLLTGIDLVEEKGVAAMRSAIGRGGHGQIVLVHAAGHFSGFTPLHTVRRADLSANLAGNVLSFIGAVEATIPAMRAGRDGRVVGFSAKTLDESYPFMGPFNLSKAALESAVRTLANENARFGIAVNIFRLATLKTEAEAKVKPNGDFEGWLDPDWVAVEVLKLTLASSSALNGNRFDLWNYSESFHGNSMLARNSLTLETIDPNEG